MRRILLILATIAAFYGCRSSYKGGKIVEGTDAFVGANMPLSDGVVQFEVLNYLSGARFSFDRNAMITFNYCVTNDISFCGYKSQTVKNMAATLTPTNTNGVCRAEFETR